MMTSRERVLKAFGKMDGKPDRVPLQFDLCRSLIEHFGRSLGIKAEYALSYYEDLTYRISANAIRTALGSDCVVVGGTVARGFEPVPVGDGATLNEFGMWMKPSRLYVDVVKCPLAEVSSEAGLAAWSMPDPFAPGRFDAARENSQRASASCARERAIPPSAALNITFSLFLNMSAPTVSSTAA